MPFTDASQHDQKIYFVNIWDRSFSFCWHIKMCSLVIIWEDGTAVDQKETAVNKKMMGSCRGF